MRIPSLDGLRAISISLVLLGHLAGTRGFVRLAAFRPFGDFANFGVRVFFVISGFLITTLLLHELGRTGRVSLPMFYLRRTLRIFPAFYAFVLTILGASALGLCMLHPHDAIHALTYTINFDPGRSWWLGHAWSLAVEEQFYLLWPAVLCLFGVRGGMKAALGAIIAAPLVRIGIIYFLPSYTDTIGEAFPTICDALACGCLLAGVRERLWRAAWYRNGLSSRMFWAIPILAFTINTYPAGRLRFGVLETLINLAIALTVDRCVRFPADAVGRVLNTRPLVFVGVLSYSLYLWQQPFLNRDHPSWLSSFPLNILLVIAAAWLSYRWIERPFLDLRRTIETRVAESRARLSARAA